LNRRPPGPQPERFTRDGWRWPVFTGCQGSQVDASCSHIGPPNWTPNTCSDQRQLRPPVARLTRALSRGCATLVLRRRQCCSSSNPGVSLATRRRLLSARCREEASVCEMLAGGRMRVCAPARYSAKGPRLSRCPEASGSRSYPGPASNVKVVPTAHCTNASGMARAIAWTALQPEQCAGRTRPTPAARSASTVGWMRASNSPPVR
jgi:hypothetical protein